VPGPSDPLHQGQRGDHDTKATQAVARKAGISRQLNPKSQRASRRGGRGGIPERTGGVRRL